MASLTVLADALYREEVARARAMQSGEKLLEGPRLFDRACRLMADGLRHRHPDLDDKAVLAMVAMQLDLLKALEATAADYLPPRTQRRYASIHSHPAGGGDPLAALAA